MEYEKDSQDVRPISQKQSDLIQMKNSIWVTMFEDEKGTSKYLHFSANKLDGFFLKCLLFAL
jgi:hypothetical protein